MHDATTLLRKYLMERSYTLFPGIGLEIFQHHLCNDKSPGPSPSGFAFYLHLVVFFAGYALLGL